MAQRQVLYQATQPLGSAQLTKAGYTMSEANRGLVPYFVSGPLSRSGAVGFVGTLLHVAAWLVAVIVSAQIGSHIHQDSSPGAWQYWVAGYTVILIGFIVLLLATIVHAFPGSKYKFPEGAAPPFMMTLFITGVQISLTFDLLTAIASSSGTNNDFFFVNSSLTATEQDDERSAQRMLLVWSIMAKFYVIGFLKNNQEWAGPANELKKLVAEE